MIAAALTFLASGAGRFIAAGLVGALLLAGAYQTGVNAERKRGEAASLRSEVAVLKADLAIASAAALAAEHAERSLAAASLTDQETIDALIAELAKRPAGARGGLSADDARRLRLIR